MMLFRKNERMDVLEKTQSNLEQTQRNLEQIQRNLDATSQMMLESRENTSLLAPENLAMDDVIEDMEPLQAAYALNLCTVSVTQIVDYMDLNIMEQEYDMILNNLNLQNMPDDDALLEILKQILNTITFFKIDQKEREFVERDYQQKMKDAVWSAVPNIGALVATGLSQGPGMMAMSLAASVGTAYMSYRKQKAENQNAYEREMWQLEKSAIEQFDGLKRELFDTAWRLAKHYQFDDKYRLTERQIHQYNAILMDSDNDRKYARLEAIAENFKAYPSFWYQFGHVANLVALEANEVMRDKNRTRENLEEKRARALAEDELKIIEEIAMLNQEIADLNATVKTYQEYAKKHFEYYQSANRYNLLREDKIASMCNIEYVELMLQMGIADKTTLIGKLEDAAKYAGESLEVLQLCAFAYMKMGETAFAEKYLKILVNESHNSIMNAQILSSLYVHQFFSQLEKRPEVRWNYSVLSRRVPSVYLFPMPKTLNADKSELEKQFLYIQKFSLVRKYEFVLNELTRKYALIFNECIPQIKSIRYDSYSFEDTYESRNRMREQLVRFVDRDKDDTFRNKLMQKDIFEEYTDVIQKYFNKLYELLKDKKNPLADFEYQCLKEDLLSPISHNKEEIDEFRRSIQNPDVDPKIIVNMLFEKYTFMFFVKEMLSTYTDNLTEKISILEKMNEISHLEAVLLEFCNNNGLSMPMEIFSATEENTTGLKTNYLYEQLIGGDEYNRLKKKNELRKKISEMIVHYYNNKQLIIRCNKSCFYVRGINDNELDFYLSKIRRFSSTKADILAVIEEKGISDLFNRTDLWLATDGVAIVKGDKAPIKYTPYAKVVMTDKDIRCEAKKYSNSDDVDMLILRDMLVEIKKIVGEDAEYDIKHAEFANQCFEALGGEDTPRLCLNV